jgi:predicted O-methyltransferase YrrM
MSSEIEFTHVSSPRSARGSFFAHPFFAWLGLRAPLAQHTLMEHEALMRHACNAQTAVEIGVAEGASAVALRAAMPPSGTLHLIDPFHLSRIPALNFLKRAARRTVNSAGTARINWIEAFSGDAVGGWNAPIDFLFIDGDHREEAVERDWLEWSPFVKQEGVIAFHDARLFPSGWPTPDYGPVKFINRAFRQNAGSNSWLIAEEVDSLVFVVRRNRS